jgi:uncharacterized protein YqeY
MPTMRQAFAERLKQALKARDARTVSTVRLMLAALNERDVASPAGEATSRAFRKLRSNRCCKR